MKKKTRETYKFMKLMAIFLVMCFFAFIIIEGFFSTVLFMYNVTRVSGLPERKHTQYDALLGWINKPNLYIKDMYGTSKSIKTNSQSFRNDKDFTKAVPPDKLRIICSGDSFTFGFGVDDSDAWVNLLASQNKHLETINMGLGGFGLDQSYLWYMRDGIKFDHDIHIIAFITNALYRIPFPTFCGYAKPILKIKDGQISVDNVPVPSSSLRFPLLRNINICKEELRSIVFFRKVFKKIFHREENNYDLDAEIREILISVIESLDRISKEKNCVLVVLYLPTDIEYSNYESYKWENYLSKELAKRRIVFIDLLSEFRKLPEDKINNLFDFSQGGHYSAEGNKYISKVLYEKLFSTPEINNKFLKIRQ